MKKQGSITVEVEVVKSLGRSKKVQLDLSWEDMLDLPITGDGLSVDRFELTVVRGPMSDEMLLDQPQLAFSGDGEPACWSCRYDGDWIQPEVLVSQLRKDPRVLRARVSR